MRPIRYLILIAFFFLSNLSFAQEEPKTETPTTPVSEPSPEPVVTPISEPKTETPVNPEPVPVSPNPDPTPDLPPTPVVTPKVADNNKVDATKKETRIEVQSEIVSDFIWRGMSFSGEAFNRRNNESYKSMNFVPSYQPTIDIHTPLEGFSVQLWGNFQLTDRHNRDNDYRLLQSYPGGPGPSYIGQPPSGDPCVDSISANGATNTDLSSKCAPNQAFGQGVKPYKENNGMKNSDGLFTAFYYAFDKSGWGTFTVGTWFYNTFHKSYSNTVVDPYNLSRPRPSRMAWQEYYIFWKMPFLREANPTLSYYTQVSGENSGALVGKNYLSLTLSHEFFEGQFFRITPSTNIGYTFSNNNIESRNGIQDITTALKFNFDAFFIKTTHVHRPNLYLYDSDYYFGAVGGMSNRTNNDGMIVDPSKVHGADRQYVFDYIDQIFNKANDPANIYLKEKLTLQKIQRNLFWFSIGYTKTF